MQINQLLSAITQTIHSHLPDLKDVSTHAGWFDLGEVKWIANHTPAVKVALMEAREFKAVETEQPREGSEALARRVVQEDIKAQKKKSKIIRRSVL